MAGVRLREWTCFDRLNGFVSQTHGPKAGGKGTIAWSYAGRVSLLFPGSQAIVCIEVAENAEYSRSAEGYNTEGRESILL